MYVEAEGRPEFLWWTHQKRSNSHKVVGQEVELRKVQPFWVPPPALPHPAYLIIDDLRICHNFLICQIVTKVHNEKWK